ncbi:protoporphyrinogen oxidase [Capnocytophaga stomatis]|uniref:menaquinone-dependent protoporphyrinogen IX dehydrogenase n=1 Tax=Capnocytophaga stomatis TaxID=1848904 RepID=UPI00194ECA2A|nr:menaquinone-dependent protoporphyrinogen IX dehydrogenase [Capnocytophaga stomatis]GIJ92855.1 protoporphyrinogen oxidase [Capnocytophaga stomatis]GIJ97329.1 protoporphyrinogen oxidase [Capnocytophaga stomatis]GIM50135.1 protoporphyrinogen oxidase [Capnocytophaga stomatis]
MEKSVIIYASVDGQTKKICERIKEVLLSKNQNAEMISIADFRGNLDDFDKIILASSIRYGKHNQDIVKLIDENHELLNTKKSVFISVNLVARKAEKRQADTNPYVVKFLNKIKWKPTVVEVFAGKINYKIYGFFDKLIIKLIMTMTKGPTNSDAEIEYTNWDNVNAFAERFSKM